LRAEVAEDELGSDKSETEQPVHGVAGLLKKHAPDLNLEDKNGEGNLQAESPANGFEADRRLLVEKM